MLPLQQLSKSGHSRHRKAKPLRGSWGKRRHRSRPKFLGMLRSLKTPQVFNGLTVISETSHKYVLDLTNVGHTWPFRALAMVGTGGTRPQRDEHFLEGDGVRRAAARSMEVSDGVDDEQDEQDEDRDHLHQATRFSRAAGRSSCLNRWCSRLSSTSGQA